MTDATRYVTGGPWAAASPAQFVARWFASWLTRPVFTAREAAIMTGRPGSDLDDIAPVACAADVGIATTGQVVAFAAALERWVGQRIGPGSPLEVGHGNGPGREIRAAQDEVGIDPARARLVLPRWILRVAGAEVSMRPYDGGVEPITVWPGPASVEPIVLGLVELVRWLPAMRWADYIVGWHRCGDRAADHDVWNGVEEADQLVVIALIGMAIQRAARIDRLRPEQVTAGFLSQVSIVRQFATPKAVATLLAGPRPPDEIAGRQHDRLVRLGRGVDDLVVLADTVLADYRRTSATDSAVYLDGPTDAPTLADLADTRVDPPSGVYLTGRGDRPR